MFSSQNPKPPVKLTEAQHDEIKRKRAEAKAKLQLFDREYDGFMAELRSTNPHVASDIDARVAAGSAPSHKTKSTR